MLLIIIVCFFSPYQSYFLSIPTGLRGIAKNKQCLNYSAFHFYLKKKLKHLKTQVEQTT